MSGRQPPANWSSSFQPQTLDARDPSKALYDSNDTSIVLWQLGKMRQAGLDFVISSWWGKSSYEDAVLRKILFEVVPRSDNPYRDLKWSIVYDSEIFLDPAVERIVDDLKYISATFGRSNNIFRMHGKIVLFVSGGPNDQVDYSRRWNAAARWVGGFYLVLKAFRGHSAVASYADAWYQFAPTNRIQYDSYHWGFVSPGYSRYDEAVPRLSRNPEEFEMALRRLRETNVPFALIETWNDWNDGTQIEPGMDLQTGERYDDVYVDLVRRIMKEEGYASPQRPKYLFGILLLTVIVMLVAFPYVASPIKKAISKWVHSLVHDLLTIGEIG